ncbi:MAG: sigma-70 family RNA polymerase sigma factor [Oscillospiraceae bacterium]
MSDYSIYSDNELQKMAVTGDDAAEEQLAERYSRLVRICARPFFLAGGDSEDLTQEGMLGLLSAIRQYDMVSEATFKTYAEHCIRNRLLTAVKSATRQKHIPLNDGVSLEYILSDESQTHSAAFPQAFTRNPEEQVLARESEKEFYSTFSRCLSQFECNILHRYLEGLSYREIARETGRTEKSVDNAVQRIRRKLARQPNLGDFSKS